MRNRLIAGAVALVLALGGTLALLAYVRGADSRALAGAQTRPVLVVTVPVAAGTAGDALADSVTVAQVPASLVAPGAVTDLSTLAGRVAAVDLQPGEQLLDARFVTAAERGAQSLVAVPDGMVTTTVLLEPQRALGGAVAPGDTVAVFISQSGSGAGGLTHLQLHSALVTAVQGAPAATPAPDTASTSSGEVSNAAAASTLPSTSILVTLALAPTDAERLVWGAEHGTLWLSEEPVGTPDGGTRVLDSGSVYQ